MMELDSAAEIDSRNSNLKRILDYVVIFKASWVVAPAAKVPWVQIQCLEWQQQYALDQARTT